MNKNKTNKLFLAIIGLIFVSAAVLSGCGGGGSSNNGSNNARANTTKSPNAANTPSANIPAGAVPAHYKGGAAAAVTVEEFADFQCPTCAVLHPTVQQIQAAYGDRIKIIFRNYPLQQLHPKAYDAAVAAESAGLQGKFWDMQNLLFNNQQAWATSSDHRQMFEEYAQRLGLDVEKFKDDMAGMAAKQRVDKDLERARAMNIGGTPSFLINGNPLPSDKLDFNSMRQMIDNELVKAQAQQAPPQGQQPQPQGAQLPQPQNQQSK